MRLALVLLAFLALAPVAAAQVPQAPDVVATVCASVGGAAPDVRDQIPVCPKADPQPADPTAAHEHDHGAAAGSPQDAPALAADAVDTAQQAAQEPASAPEHVLGFVATLVQFVKDLLHLPIVAGAHVADASLGAAHAIRDAAVTARDATASAATRVRDASVHALAAVTSLFASHTESHAIAAPVSTAAPVDAHVARNLLAPVQRLVSS